MNTKVDNKYSDLIDSFKTVTGWHKARVKCAVSIICAMCKLQTVSFVKLAQGFEGQTKYESNHRRIQRFFAEFVIDRYLLARLIFSLLPHKPPYKLSLDRTNWKFGKTDINILMLSVCYKGVAMPLLWKMLPKRGNSNAEERKELLNEYIKLFGVTTISSFLGDREFIGEPWFEELIRHKVPFFIRIKENMKVKIPRKGIKRAFWLFNHLRTGQYYHIEGLVYLGKNLVYLSGIKTFNPATGKVEFVIIASFNKQDQALIDYKERWQIETMFKAMKSSGFNLEDTHLNNLDRLTTLIAVVAIAFVWAYLAGIDKHENISPIKVKKHGRRAYSFFKYGLIRIAHAIMNTLNVKEFNDCVKVLSCT
ncbi:IS4 family transposase [Marinilabilia salmonicolor]|uniref:DDE family transposase n=1 Tax=Marinilabilia salmonicolor TaxID=989 RepID=A0A368V941_9BACT|nr:IS4 family transposase [Marinilabilia salmonicolor]RCW36785.1 DDE family transposase [Marinilabilia salmonicolor]